MDLPSPIRPSPWGRDRFPARGPGLGRGVEGWNRGPQRAFLMGFSLVVLLYSGAVFFLVAYMGDIGVRCVFSTVLQEEIATPANWGRVRPHKGDTLLSVGSIPIANFTDYVKAVRGLGDR